MQNFKKLTMLVHFSSKVSGHLKEINLAFEGKSLALLACAIVARQFDKGRLLSRPL